MHKEEYYMRRSHHVQLLFLLLAFAASAGLSQTVTTFAPGSGISGPNGFAVDKHGNLYVANEGSGNGTTVSVVTPGGVASTFATGFNGPDGLAFDTAG